jgi:hypothetical protein
VNLGGLAPLERRSVKFHFSGLSKLPDPAPLIMSYNGGVGRNMFGMTAQTDVRGPIR